MRIHVADAPLAGRPQFPEAGHNRSHPARAARLPVFPTDSARFEDPAARRRAVLFGPLLALLGQDPRACGPRLRDLRAALESAGLGGTELRSLTGAAASPFRDWWTRYPPVMTGAFRLYAVLELAASRILAWQPSGVPALVQVPAWAREDARRDTAVPAGDEVAVAAAAAARQAAVLAGPYPARAEVVLGSRPDVAGMSGPAAAGQARRLAVPPDGVQVRHAPGTAGRLAAPSPFTILTFGSGPWDAVVYRPGPGGGALLTGRDEVRAHLRLFEALGRHARPYRCPPGPPDNPTRTRKETRSR